jgi:molybdopterin/thiamine biosynthesis adenylyltransferase
MDGDPFNRQKGIDKWNQALIEKQVCFVLGAGGIGSSVAFGLARLGVARIILWDFDTVDVTNLNRQILFNKADVGRSKVEAAVHFFFQQLLLAD